MALNHGYRRQGCGILVVRRTYLNLIPQTTFVLPFYYVLLTDMKLFRTLRIAKNPEFYPRCVHCQCQNTRTPETGNGEWTYLVHASALFPYTYTFYVTLLTCCG